MKTFDLHSQAPAQAPAYLSNGVLGLRVAALPFASDTAFLSGFVGRREETGGEAIATAPYPLGADLVLNGLRFSEAPHHASFEKQSYDFSNAELCSRFRFSSGEATLQVEVVTLCLRTQPSLAIQQISVRADRDCEVQLQAHIELPRQGQLLARVQPDGLADGVLHWQSRGARTTCGAAYRTAWRGDASPANLRHRRNSWGSEEGLVLTEHSFDAKAGQTYVLHQYGCLVPELWSGEPHWQAARNLEYAVMRGFDALREENRVAWRELWRARPLLVGADPQWQDVADSAFFYVHTSTHAAMPFSVAPFGLSDSAYDGHVFWDAESFLLPSVLLSNPDAARAMLDYRFERGAMARAQAAMNGYGGWQFPWQSGLRGEELTVIWHSRGATLSHHVTPDIAVAAAQYAHATGDELWEAERGWPLLRNVADWIVARAEPTARGFEIRHVTGPDEWFDDVSNNAHTNLAAQTALQQAIALAQKRGYSAPQRWRDVADKLFVPRDENGALLKHEGYQFSPDDPKTGGICCPETLAALQILGARVDAATKSATNRFHLDHSEEFPGMPMLGPLLGVAAAHEGEREQALQLLEAAILGLRQEPFWMWAETSGKHSWEVGPRSTVFLTNPGGLLASLWRGFAGLRPADSPASQWENRPVTLPAGWDAIEYERLWLRGQPHSVRAAQGAPAEIHPL